MARNRTISNNRGRADVEKQKLLIIEDDEFVRNQMKWALSDQHDVQLAEDRKTALALLKEHRPPVVTLDLGLPPSPGDTTEGFLTLSEMIQADPLVKVIVITGQGEQQNALEAIGIGAFDFFCKPVDIEALKVVIGRAAFIYEMEAKRRAAMQSGQTPAFEGMVGKSPQMLKVFDSIRKVAGSNAPVLIGGESGTGKEMAARAIHRLSSRKSGPFVAINCGAIPENLIESELFGHEKGAFTGAHMRREGRMELANGGTLFLDEIGELALPLQVKLLRVIQEGEVERVGGRKAIRVDTRLVCATNSDLRAATSEGRFREDLYYRIAVVTIQLPPLRERKGDIQHLAGVFLDRLAAEQGKTLSFSPQASVVMEEYNWPGNVRELDNRLRRAVIMAERNQITPSDLELSGRSGSYEAIGLNEAREAVEKELVEKALVRNRGNLTRCAEELKISRPTLYELIDKLGIVRKGK